MEIRDRPDSNIRSQRGSNKQASGKSGVKSVSDTLANEWRGARCSAIKELKVGTLFSDDLLP